MKHKGLIFSTLFLFALSLYLAYYQVDLYYDLAATPSASALIQTNHPFALLSGIEASFLSYFSTAFTFLISLFNGSLVAAMIVLALLVELVTLYPAVQIQLKQKKIHLFHKKLVDRFKSGELSIGKTNREMDILYAVNEKMHRKGAALFLVQLVIFVTVLTGLYLLSVHPEALKASFSTLNFALLAKPLTVNVPALAALAYLLHALIKIALRQQEDYINPVQIYVALTFGILGAVAIFFFAGIFSTLLSLYLLTQITFASMRYLILEDHAAQWGKVAQKELIKMLRDTPLKKNKIEHLSQGFNHLAPVRHLNFHLLEEGISMSFVFVLTLSSLQIL